MQPRLLKLVSVWCYIGLVLVSVYIPLLPPILFSVAPKQAGGGARSSGMSRSGARRC